MKVAVGGQAIRAPFYNCVSTSRSNPYGTPLRWQSPCQACARSATQSASSPETGLADASGTTATALEFSGSLPVRGAQPSQIALNETTRNASAATFKVVGRLRPPMRRIWMPACIQRTFDAAGGGLAWNAHS